MVTVAIGGGQFTLIEACAWQSELHCAAALHMSVPWQLGGLTAAEQLPWHVPVHMAIGCVYLQVPPQVPMHMAMPETAHWPMHIALH
jgi:hypothetical protein